MKKIVLILGLTLALFSCKKDDNNNETPSTTEIPFPKTIVKEEVSNIATVITTESYTLDSENKITSLTKKIVDNNTPTTDEIYTINYNGNMITSIAVKNNSQSNRDYTYNFNYSGNYLQSITRSDNVQKITYEYVNGKVVSKTTVDGSETKKYSYTYESGKIKMVASNPTPGFNDHFTYTLNSDGTVASLEKITHIGKEPKEDTKGTCTYQYDNKPNIFQRDVFKYLAEIELISKYDYYGDYYRDPLLRTGAHNIVSYTKNLVPDAHPDYQDLENATRSFHYQWNNGNSPKSMEYKKNNNHKANYTYTY